jgi:hypothetical protein
MRDEKKRKRLKDIKKIKKETVILGNTASMCYNALDILEVILCLNDNMCTFNF